MTHLYTRFWRRRNYCAPAALAVLISCSSVVAQPRLAGSEKIELDLRSLSVTGSALMIGAHPDDENTALLAWLARGRHVRTAYLSLTRGEGGQNLIGAEQGDAMGLIRTEELLAARHIDGAQQFFTRAIDFGFTKTAQEALDKWGEKEILGDVVWVIRKFQPDVIILRFSGTPRDGHGQHQASAILGKEAFFAAADPTRYPEQLRWVKPWKAKRLMWNVFAFTPEQRKEAAAMKGKIEFDPGAYDPLLGYSYREIAGMSRTMHRSQGMGAPQTRGSAQEYLTLVAGEAATKDLFDGIDLSWNRVPGGAAVGAAIEQALRAVTPDHPERAIAPLVAARKVMEKLGDPISERKRSDLDEAIAECAGLWLDAVSDHPDLVPGMHFKITATAIARGPEAATLDRVDVAGMSRTAGKLPANEPKAIEFDSQIPADASYSQPYWLVAPKEGYRYAVQDPQEIGQPDNPPVYDARFEVGVGGAQITVHRPVEFRYIDHQRGELTRPLAIVPSVEMTMPGRALMFASREGRKVEVRVASARADDAGTLQLMAPDGWRVEPAERSFHFADAGQEQALEFLLTPPGEDSIAELRAVAKVDGREVTVATQRIDYTHIPPRFLFPAAESRLARADVRTLAKHIGYIMGAGDEVPDALRQIGCDVTLLGPTDLAEADLSRFDAIVTGVRAYNVRPDLVANNQRLLDYVERGGTLVVQYNTIDKTLERIGPYPIKFNHDRVTVEDSPVKFLDPGNTVMKEPNAITERDFDGWIQERGLYFAYEWDKRYQPLFSMNDPGEKPLQGSTLVTRYGKGAFVFTGISFFRELPAGVPGAYRLFANLLSAGKAQ